jgi:2-polyprenyl-3-methyl-5-hydroxy-6-metoxy-1,4-benzoquinol methylase
MLVHVSIGASALAGMGRLARRAGRRVHPDPRRDAELQGERVVFRSLEREGFLERFRGGRILEVGPKHGEDSLLLATLRPAELVLIDLPEKRQLVQTWLPALQALCLTLYLEANLLYVPPDELSGLGQFDLVFCLGVVYHNAEQLRLLRRLFNLCVIGGALVLESSTTRDRRLADLNAVEIHWPEPYRGTENITHHPSRRALKSWLEMVGFAEVEIRDVYSRDLSWQRAVLTAIRPPHPSPYLSYASGEHPPWTAGEAT